MNIIGTQFKLFIYVRRETSSNFDYLLSEIF